MKPLLYTIVCVLAISSAFFSVDICAQEGEEIQPPQTRAGLKAELERCRGDKRKIEAVLDATIKEGPAGLELILDVLYPDSIPMPEIEQEEIQTIIHNLQSDDYETCKSAMLALYEIGPRIEPLLRQMVKKADHPIVRIWINGIIACWNEERIDDASQYLRVLKVKIEGLKDPESLNILASAVLVALGKSSADYKNDQLAKYIIRALAKAGNDDCSEILMPLLDHPEPGIAVLVVREMGGDNRYFPPLLLKALESNRPEVVDAAISWTPNCWDKKRNAEVHRLLRKIFEGENEALRFQACFPLMHGYGDKEAVFYLLTQTQSEDRKRALRAIGWIGDACNFGKPAYPELLENLAPHFYSEDDQLRRAAYDALGTYSGEDVVRNLIAALGDNSEIIVEEARRSLFDQHDKAMVSRLLQDALESIDNNAVRDRILQVLNNIG
jgi:HEAT repeat protein